jgi:CubicO group peptidase (beta-lactamase class C family)
VVVHRGAIVFERYPRMRADDRHLSFSVTKAFVGTLVALLEGEGRLDLSQPVTRYLPELAGTVWADIRLRDVADMASGIDGKEDADAYTNPAHKIYRMEAALGWQPRREDMPAPVREGDAYGYIRTMGRGREPGTKFEYSSIDTLMLAQVLERVTGRRLADLLSERLWGPMGAESDALMLVNERGVAIAHAGLAMTARDLARFGLLFCDRTAGAAIAPAVRGRMLKQGRPALLPPDHPRWYTHASYQWDQVHEGGVYAKGGFGGQGLYVDARRDVVVVMFGTNTTVDAKAPPMPVLRLVPALFPESEVKSP